MPISDHHDHHAKLDEAIVDELAEVVVLVVDLGGEVDEEAAALERPVDGVEAIGLEQLAELRAGIGVLRDAVRDLLHPGRRRVIDDRPRQRLFESTCA